jgi:hypothetical protein
VKVIHKAKLLSNNGDVSPMCAEIPRKLNLKRESWALVDKFVTCKKCLALQRGREATR